jgi:hypothetical protein
MRGGSGSSVASSVVAPAAVDVVGAPGGRGQWRDREVPSRAATGSEGRESRSILWSPGLLGVT